MPAAVNRLRILLVGLVCLVSVLSGVMLVFRLGTRDGVSLLSTYELLLMLGLFVMPLLTLWAWLADRRAPRSLAHAEGRSTGIDERSEPGSAWSPPQLDEDGQRSVRSWAVSPEPALELNDHTLTADERVARHADDRRRRAHRRRAGDDRRVHASG